MCPSVSCGLFLKIWDLEPWFKTCYIHYLQDLTFLVHIFYQWEHSMKSSLGNLFHPGMFNYLLLQQGTIDFISFYDIAMDNQWWDVFAVSFSSSAWLYNTDCIVADYKVYFQRCKCSDVNFWFSTFLSGHSFIIIPGGFLSSSLFLSFLG